MIAATAASPASVALASAAVGYVSRPDGVLLATSDGGRSFRVVHRGAAFGAMAFPGARQGFALAGSELRETRDGGRSWRTVRRFPAGAGRNGPGTAAVSFADASHGLVGFPDGRVYRTADGGGSWTAVRVRCAMYLGGVALASARVGFAVCGGQPATIQQQRVYWTTRDGGRTWRVLREGIFDGYVDGLDAATPALLLERADRVGIDRAPGGRPLLFTDDAAPVVSLSFADARHGLALVWGRGLLRTDDGGRHWRRLLRVRW